MEVEQGDDVLASGELRAQVIQVDGISPALQLQPKLAAPFSPPGKQNNVIFFAINLGVFEGFATMMALNWNGSGEPNTTVSSSSNPAAAISSSQCVG